MAFLAKISHLDPGPGQKIHFTHQQILELYPCLFLEVFGTWTGDRPQGFTVDIELKLELDLDQEVIVVTRCRNRLKKCFILSVVDFNLG